MQSSCFILLGSIQLLLPAEGSRLLNVPNALPAQVATIEAPYHMAQRLSRGPFTAEELRALVMEQVCPQAVVETKARCTKGCADAELSHTLTWAHIMPRTSGVAQNFKAPFCTDIID